MQDTLNYSFQGGVIGTSKSYLPLYSHALRGGVYDYDFNGVYVNSKVDYKKTITEHLSLTNKFSAYLLTQDQSLLIQEAYTEVHYDWLNFLVGWKQMNDRQIEYPTFGSYGISMNARPIPKVGFYVPEFTKLPFASGFFEFKASFFHGWFEEDRYISNPLLHEKSIYLSLGGGTRWKLWGGLNHFVVYGGVDPDSGENLYHGFDDFTKVFMGKGREVPAQGEENAIGNHLGYWIFTLSYEFNDFDVELYNESVFDDGKGWQFWNLDESKDRIVGLNFDFEEKSNLFLNKLSLLFMTTKFQQGPGLPDQLSPDIDNFGFPFGGRDDFYNNFFYRSGWTHKGRIIGNPLFIERDLSDIYFGTIPDYEVAIVNNRIRAYHLGIEFDSWGWNWRFLGTYTRNFGTYGGLYEGRFAWEGIQTDSDFEYTFLPRRDQTYFLLESKSRPFKNKKVHLGLSLTLDSGQITNNFGFGASLSYSDFLVK